MIACSCACITSDEIEHTVAGMRAADPQVVVTTGKVYRALGKKPDCDTCPSLFIAQMHAPGGDVPQGLRGLRRLTRKGTTHKRRR